MEFRLDELGDWLEEKGDTDTNILASVVHNTYRYVEIIEDCIDDIVADIRKRQILTDSQPTANDRYMPTNQTLTTEEIGSNKEPQVSEKTLPKLLTRK